MSFLSVNNSPVSQDSTNQIQTTEQPKKFEHLSMVESSREANLKLRMEEIAKLLNDFRESRPDSIDSETKIQNLAKEEDDLKTRMNFIYNSRKMISKDTNVASQ